MKRRKFSTEEGIQMPQTSLFDQENDRTAPLASRVRPTSLDDFVGQSHLVGEGKFLREMIDNDQVPSMIFLGTTRCRENHSSRDHCSKNTVNVYYV